MQYLKVRPLLVGDAEAWRGLRMLIASEGDSHESAAHRAEEQALSVETVARQIRDGRVFGAFSDDGRLLGAASLDVVSSGLDAFAQWLGAPAVPQLWLGIRLVAVHPTARGQGIVDHLMRRCIGNARRRRANGILLTVKTANERAKAAYRRHGFKEFRDAGPDGVDMHLVFKP